MAKKIEELLREGKIGSLKRPKAFSVPKDTLAEEAVRIMQENRNGYVVVVDENNKALGIFTEKDVTLHILLKEADLKVPVTRYLKGLRALTLNDSVGTAVDLMHTYQYRHIPLVDDKGILMGILSARAIIRFLAENFPAEVLNLPPRSGQISLTREGG